MMERNLSVDILKIFLAIIIIALHGKIFIDVNEDLFFYLVNGFFRVGVPVFLVISGYYLYNVKNFKGWFNRVLILYLIWTLFYSFIWFQPLNSVKNTITDIMFLFFGFHHLWYLAGLLLGGLLVYLIKDKNYKIQIFLALTIFIIGTTIQYIGNLHIFNGVLDKILNIYYFHRNFITVCFPLLMLGFLINKFNIDKKIDNIGIYLIIGISLLFVEVWFNYNFISKKESLDQMYSLIFICPVIFILFLKMNFVGKSKEIALFSTGMYLVHPLIQFTILKSIHVNTIYIFLITLVLSLVLSKALIILNSRYKYVL